MKKYLFVVLFLLLPILAHADANPTIPTASDVSTTTLENASATFQLSGISNDAGTITFATTTGPADGTLGNIAADGTLTYTPDAGFTGSDSFQFISTEGATSSTPATATINVSAPPPLPSTATISIRDGSTLIGPFTFAIPDSSQNLSITPDEGTTTPVVVPADTVLGAIDSLATGANGFTLTDIEYFDFGQPYAGGLYLNCVSIPAATSTPLCADWQYQVDGSAPQVGAGTITLQNGDNVILYFGFPRQVFLSASSVATCTPVTATAETYNPESDTFAPAAGVTIGVTQPDPSNPFSPLEIATSTVDSNGQAVFTLDATGTYNVGIQQDFYFPTTELDVVDATSSNSGSSGGSGDNVPPSGGGGGGGGGGGISHSQLNIPSAVAYLAGKQNSDGSFDSSLYTDWAALALVAGNGGSSLQKIKNYELTASPALSSATDFERHAMALEALGINPYSGTPTNYIAPIIADFDGTQAGDPLEDNDDIFALLALTSAGYTSDDAIIQKEIAFVLSKQQPDGSWDESPDLTAAAIQALGPLVTDPQTAGQVLGAAAGYLGSSEKSDASWNESIDSTSWVQTAINGIIQAQTPGFSDETPWTSSAGLYPTDYIAEQQQSDGAVRPISDSVDSRVWSTSYAIVAASGESWDSLLQPFSKPGASDKSGAGGGSIASTNATSTSATSTPPITATSTPPVATSTPLVLSASTTSVTTATTTAITPPVSPPKKKPAAHPKPTTPTTPATSTTNADSGNAAQTAAASTAVSGNFFSSIWNAITSFFASVF